MSKRSVLPAVLAATVALASESLAAAEPPPEPEEGQERPAEPPQAPRKQVPSVSRIVHFHFEFRGQLVTRPAIIVRVWDPEKHEAYQNDEVNLRVFLDGDNDGEGHGTGDWKTSIPRSDEPQAGHWSWPPFVAAR